MAQVQGPRPKAPLDVLQSMTNAILIETGKALRATNKDNKENGRTIASANSRLRQTIPSATDNFHQALDELECDILRARSVILRDFELLRAKRIALENPEPIVEQVEPEIEEPVDMDQLMGISAVDDQPSPTFSVKAEDTESKSPEKVKLSQGNTSAQPTPIPPPGTTPQTSQDIKVQRELTPPASTIENSTNTKPIGLGIDTEGITAGSAEDAADLPVSSIDSLFDLPDTDNNNEQSELNFDDMDFAVQDTSGNTQDASQSQTQVNDFDLSSFGNTQDLNLSGFQNSGDNNAASSANNNVEEKQVDDLLNLGNTSGGGDMMDLDLDFGTGDGDGSAFDDMFFGSGDAGDINNGGEMEHEFDNAFFGI